MLSKTTNSNLQDVFGGGKMSKETLEEILGYMKFYNREEYYVGVAGEGKFFLFDSEPTAENFHITKESILHTLNN
jgi:hypothetical protein